MMQVNPHEIKFLFHFDEWRAIDLLKLWELWFCPIDHPSKAFNPPCEPDFKQFHENEP